MQYVVKVIQKNTQITVETLGPMSRTAAIRVERGVNINLNHDDYYTQIEGVLDDRNRKQDADIASK